MRDDPVLARSALPRLRDTFRHDPLARWSVILLVSANALIIAIHVATDALRVMGMRHLALVESHPLSVSREGGPAEIFNYGQAGLCAALLATAFVRTGARIHAFWAVVFLLVLADDAAMLHERGGRMVASVLPRSEILGLRSQDLGELATWGGLALLVLVAGAWMRRDPGPPADRAFGRLFLLAFAALVVFAVGVDMLHSALRHMRWLEHGLAIVEDGGEMLAIGFAYGLAILIHREARTASPDTTAVSARRRG